MSSFTPSKTRQELQHESKLAEVHAHFDDLASEIRDLKGQVTAWYAFPAQVKASVEKLEAHTKSFRSAIEGITPDLTIEKPLTPDQNRRISDLQSQAFAGKLTPEQHSAAKAKILAE